MRKLIYDENKAKAVEHPQDKQHGISEEAEKNINTDVLSEIGFLQKHTGKAVSMQLFERLKHKYDFSTILQELLIMQQKGELTWEEAPQPPDALSEVQLVKTL